VKKTFLILAALTIGLLAGCEPPGADLEKAEPQPAADLEAGAKAQTMDEWAKANPNNGAAGHGDAGGK
jgi:uncharacterized lipoprotein YajG